LAIVLKNNNYIQSALKQKIEIFNKGEYQWLLNDGIRVPVHG
jgi:hypothetical protein